MNWPHPIRCRCYWCQPYPSHAPHVAPAPNVTIGWECGVCEHVSPPTARLCERCGSSPKANWTKDDYDGVSDSLTHTPTSNPPPSEDARCVCERIYGGIPTRIVGYARSPVCPIHAPQNSIREQKAHGSRESASEHPPEIQSDSKNCNSEKCMLASGFAPPTVTLSGDLGSGVRSRIGIAEPGVLGVAQFQINSCGDISPILVTAPAVGYNGATIRFSPGFYSRGIIYRPGLP